jgi:acetyltransferase-like isoleucine patch superfamily enzyme
MVVANGRLVDARATAVSATFRHAWALLVQRSYLQLKHRRDHLRIGFGTICEDVGFSRFNTIHSLVRLRSVTLGDATYIANGARIVAADIGKFCSIGPSCKIGLGTHPTRGLISTHPAFYSNNLPRELRFAKTSQFQEQRRVHIANDVWIGDSAIVLDGLSIENGAIVGAGAVVTRNVPAYAVVAGVPARTVRFRFADSEIAALIEFAWWDRDLEWIRANAAQFLDIKNLPALMRTP